MQIKSLNYKTIFNSLFIIGAGSWLFLTNMLDRYFFAGVVGGLFVTMHHPKLFKYWLITSLIFGLNLYRGWWFPESLGFVKHALIDGNGIAGFFLSIANVWIYLIMAKNILRDKEIMRNEASRNIMVKPRLT